VAEPEAKGPTLYVVRRELDPVRPVAMKFKYKSSGRRATKTVLFTHSKNRTHRVPEGLVSVEVPKGEKLWAMALPMLAPLAGLPLAKVVMVLPALPAFSNLAEMAIFGIFAAVNGIDVEFTNLQDDQPLPFAWFNLAQACLSYAGLPDDLAVELVLADLLEPAEHGE